VKPVALPNVEIELPVPEPDSSGEDDLLIEGTPKFPFRPSTGRKCRTTPGPRRRRSNMMTSTPKRDTGAEQDDAAGEEEEAEGMNDTFAFLQRPSTSVRTFAELNDADEGVGLHDSEAPWDDYRDIHDFGGDGGGDSSDFEAAMDKSINAPKLVIIPGTSPIKTEQDDDADQRSFGTEGEVSSDGSDGPQTVEPQGRLDNQQRAESPQVGMGSSFDHHGESALDNYSAPIRTPDEDHGPVANQDAQGVQPATHPSSPAPTSTSHFRPAFNRQSISVSGPLLYRERSSNFLPTSSSPDKKSPEERQPTVSVSPIKKRLFKDSPAPPKSPEKRQPAVSASPIKRHLFRDSPAPSLPRVPPAPTTRRPIFEIARRATSSPSPEKPPASPKDESDVEIVDEVNEAHGYVDGASDDGHVDEAEEADASFESSASEGEEEAVADQAVEQDRDEEMAVAVADGVIDQEYDEEEMADHAINQGYAQEVAYGEAVAAGPTTLEYVRPESQPKTSRRRSLAEELEAAGEPHDRGTSRILTCSKGPSLI
jgi:hypothetical protein